MLPLKEMAEELASHFPKEHTYRIYKKGKYSTQHQRAEQTVVVINEGVGVVLLI